jgi:hypothetical protein
MTTPTLAARMPCSLQVPPTWFEFDVWRATRTGDLARLVDRRIGADTRLRPWRGALLKALRAAAEQAEREGAVMCAAMTDPFGDDGVLAALLTVFHTIGDPDPAGNTVEEIAAQLTAIAPTEASADRRRVEIITLDSGPAVRVYGTETVDLGGHPVESVVMHTLIPVPDGDGVLNVVLASPQAQLAEAMLGLFEAISNTFAWAEEMPVSA